MLARLAEDVAARVRQVPGAADVSLSTRGQKPELIVNVDRAFAGTLGLTVGQVAQALRPAFAGIDAGDWVDPSGETRNVTVRLTPEARTSASDLRKLSLVVGAAPAIAQDGARLNNGPALIPLGQIAEVKEGLGPAQIDHVDRERVISVEANVVGADLGTGEGADFRAPLGQAVIGGVITSTILTLLLIPTFSAGNTGLDQNRPKNEEMRCMAESLLQIVLWLLVINLGIAFGAGLYESRITIPQWLNAAPGYGYRWNAGAARQANVGLRFWVYVTTVPLTILTLVSMVVVWWTHGAVRIWWLIAVVAILVDRVLTFAYFIPTMIKLMGDKINPESKAVAKALQWVHLGYVRHSATLLAWLAVLQAFALIQ